VLVAYFFGDEKVRHGVGDYLNFRQEKADLVRD